MAEHDIHEDHGHSVAAWTGVAVILVGTAVMSLAVVFPSVLWFVVGAVIALAGAIGDTSDLPPEIARLQGLALAGVFQIIIADAGRRTVEAQSQEKIADELYPVIANVLDQLDRWFAAP